jgi:hypothetical protein
MNTFRGCLLLGVSLVFSGCLPSNEASDQADSDGDGLTDFEESELGTDPTVADTDSDGTDDGAEVDCGANPLDEDEACYLCGWDRNDPGTFTATGNERGDTIENVTLVDQCHEQVPLWDFAGEYYVLWMTAAW